MTTYAIDLSPVEEKALAAIAVSPQEWIENAIRSRCRASMDEIVKTEVHRRLDAGEPIPPTRDEIVLAAPIRSARQANEDNEAEMRRQIALAKGQGPNP